MDRIGAQQARVAAWRRSRTSTRAARGLAAASALCCAAAAAAAAGLVFVGAAPQARSGLAAGLLPEPNYLAGAAGRHTSLTLGGSAADPRAPRVQRPAGPAIAGLLDLTGKVALVTGASRGIGQAIADRLAQAGATVIGTATSDSGAEAISARFTGDLKGKGMKLDVSDPSSVQSVLEAIEKAYGLPDILVNNAGITKDTLMMRMKEEDWIAVINTNLNSVFRLSKAVLKGMTKKRWGRIISISSVVGSMGNAGQANYAAAKAGMDGFSRALAKEVGSRAITVNTVAPGFIKTDMTDGLKEEWKAKLLEAVPLGRLGTPEEVADAVLFLASPSAGYVTGQTMHVNGGMYM